MIKLIDKQKIIISYYREGKTQRQIAREVGINRKTIRRYIREYEKKKNILTISKGSDRSELIADIVEKPKYNSSSRYKVKLTDKIFFWKYLKYLGYRITLFPLIHVFPAMLLSGW